ncbi:MAG: AI-2E family transporter [Rikenellaceae bacterium]
MTDSSSSFTLQGIARLLFGVLITAIVFYLLWYFSDVVIYILVSAVLAIMFRPLVAKVQKLRVGGYGLGRGASSLVILIFIWLLVAAAVLSLVPIVFSRVQQLGGVDFSNVVKSIEGPVLSVQNYLHETFLLPVDGFSLKESILGWGRSVADLDLFNVALSSTFGFLISVVIAFFSVSFITYYFLKDESLFELIVVSFFPTKYKGNVRRALGSVSTLLSRYFVGLMSESAIVASTVSVAMIFFGMTPSDAFFMGIVMGVINVIPYAGPFLGICFSLFLGVVSPIEALGLGGTVTAILGTLFVVEGLDYFVLQPWLYSERVKAHPLEIFIVILLSGYVAGVVGMLLAIPSYTVLRVFGKEFFSQFSLVRQLTKEL